MHFNGSEMEGKNAFVSNLFDNGCRRPRPAVSTGPSAFCTEKARHFTVVRPKRHFMKSHRRFIRSYRKMPSLQFIVG